MKSEEKENNDISLNIFIDTDEDWNQIENACLEICCEDELRETKEAYCEELLYQMQYAIMNGYYQQAYENAIKLKETDSKSLNDDIEQCLKKCAENGIIKALIYMAEQNIVKGDPLEYQHILKPEAFPYLKKLSDSGFIKSFKWLADCYSRAIGCEWEPEKANRLYFEGMLFDDDRYCREKFAAYNMELEDYLGNNPVKQTVKMMTCTIDWNKRSYARIKLAEMILNGRIREYHPESAYVILISEKWCCGIAEYLLGECLLRGIGTNPEPIIAKELLSKAYKDIENVLKDYSDDWNVTYKYGYYHTKEEYLSAYERTKALLEEAKEAKLKVLNQNNVDEEQLFDDWKNSTPLFIKRSYRK